MNQDFLFQEQPLQVTVYITRENEFEKGIEVSFLWGEIAALRNAQCGELTPLLKKLAIVRFKPREKVNLVRFNARILNQEVDQFIQEFDSWIKNQPWEDDYTVQRLDN